MIDSWVFVPTPHLYQLLTHTGTHTHTHTRVLLKLISLLMCPDHCSSSVPTHTHTQMTQLPTVGERVCACQCVRVCVRAWGEVMCESSVRRVETDSVHQCWRRRPPLLCRTHTSSLPPPFNPHKEEVRGRLLGGGFKHTHFKAFSLPCCWPMSFPDRPPSSVLLYLLIACV